MIFLGGIIFISLSLSCNKCKVFIFLTIKKYWPLFFIDNYIGFLTHAGKQVRKCRDSPVFSYKAIDLDTIRAFFYSTVSYMQKCDFNVRFSQKLFKSNAFFIRKMLFSKSVLTEGETTGRGWFLLPVRLLGLSDHSSIAFLYS